jgi:menaquinone-dependent protoporphyrinogen oxidase
MRALIIYGTTEGHTAHVTQFVEERLVAAGLDVFRQHADAEVLLADPAAYSLVIVAASLHNGRYQKPVTDYLIRHAKALNRMPSVFLSVSLSAASRDRDDLQGLYKCNADFLRETGWRPSESHLVAGAFRFTQYDFLKSWAMKYIAWRKNQSTDASRDHVLTDWTALGEIVSKLPRLCDRRHAAA